MSELIQSGLSCKSCPSSDGMAEYDNGYYCFSCHRNWWKSAQNYLTSKGIPDYNFTSDFPLGTQDELPLEAKALLYKYHFTDDMIKYAQIKYHEDCPIWSRKLNKFIGTGPRILLPAIAYDGKNTLWWEGKALDKTKQIKTINNGGKKEYFAPFNHKVTNLIIVEDILSCLRIAWGAQNNIDTGVIALRGTSADIQKIINEYMDLGAVISTRITVTGQEEILRISQGLNFYVWLDGDMPGRRAAKKLERLSLYGEVKNICTPKDPKCYSDEEIRRFINES